MKTQEYIDWMLKRESKGEYSLGPVKKLLEKLDNPQDKLKIVHITGTNGKGSTLSYIASSLKNAGLNCGEFVSPYIDNIFETIKINNEYISEEDFTKYMTIIYKEVLKLDEEGYYTSFFEIFSALSYLYFYEKKVDVCLIEVGMGGRTDATNTMKSPIAVVISSISLDHTALLGKTLTEIAYQKGGLIKENSKVFVYPQEKETMLELSRIADEKNASISTFKKDEVEILESNIDYTKFNFRNFKEVKTSILGKHQAYNASLAILVLDHLKNYFNLDDDLIKKSIFQAKNIGRIEKIQDNPTIILDGSHNKESIEGLINTIKNFKYNKLILGFSLLADKDIDNILKMIMPLADEVVLTEIDNPRKSELSVLKEKVEKYKKAYAYLDKEKAYKKTLELANKDDLILWCGSLYLLMDIRKIALKNTPTK